MKNSLNRTIPSLFSMNLNEHSPIKRGDLQRILIKVIAITRVDLAHMKRKIEDGKRSSSSIK